MLTRRAGVRASRGVGAARVRFAEDPQGLLPLAGGEMSTGETVSFGYYEQSGLGDVNPGMRVLEFVREAVATARCT